ESVRAYRREPLAENQTASTGPVAGEASISSAAVPPIFRQSGDNIWAEATPRPAPSTTQAQKASRASVSRHRAAARAVSIRHTNEFHCTVFSTRPLRMGLTYLGLARKPISGPLFAKQLWC